MSVYNAAISWQCRNQAPVAGCSIDRVALSKFAQATQQDNVESLVCFSCACIFTFVKELDEDQSQIRWHRPFEPGPGRFLGQPISKMVDLIGLRKFLEKYDQIYNGNKLTDHEDFRSWKIKLPPCNADDSPVTLLCCPEAGFVSKTNAQL